MSNYLSQPVALINPQSSINQPLIEKVLAVKQGRYDANKAKIDQTLAIYKNQLKGLRDVDNEYISTRIKEAENTINNYGNRDFSLTQTTDTLLSSLKSITEDPVVQSAVLNKAKVDQYNLQVDEIKKKKPELYNDANYQYGLYKAGVQDYLKGNTKDITTPNYTPYKDLTEEHLKRLKTITDVKGKRFIETISPDGKFKIRKEIDGLTQDEIQNYMGSLMTSEELNQMKINGWAKFGQDEKQARTIFSDYNNQKLVANTNNINLYQARANNTNLSSDQRKEASQQVEVLKDKEKTIKSNLNNIDKIPLDNIALDLEKANYLNGLSQIASTEWSQSIETNDVYYKDKELEIASEDLALKKLIAEKKYGITNSVNGVVEGAVTVSPAEVDTKDMEDQVGQENLQKRHDTYYKTILSTAKSILQNPDVEDSDKKAFEAELKSRGLDNNFNWIDKNNEVKYSKASTIKAAFDAAKLGGSYKKEAEIISDAAAKKQNIAKDIVSVEGEAYTKTFNANPDKYINFLKKAKETLKVNYQTPSPLQLVGIGTSVFGKLKDKNQQESLELSNKIDAFVKEAGGWENVKNFLDRNPNKLREFALLTDKADKTYKGIVPYLAAIGAAANPVTFALGLKNGDTVFQMGDKNLIEDAKVETEKLLQSKSKSGAISSFTDYNTINFVNEGVNADIIKSIPQDRIKGEVFDPKIPITAKLVGDNIEIEQYRGGTSEKGKFLSGTKNSKATLNKGDASYDIMMKYINAKEEEKFGLNADTTRIKLPPSKPVVIRATKEGVKAANTAYNIMQSVQSNPSISGLFLAAGGNPTAYTSDKEIAKTFEVKLADYPKEVVDNFTKEYLNRLSGFSVTPFVSKLYGEKKWAISVKNDQNEEILNTSLGIKTLDKDTRWMIENAPQTFITEYILRELISDSKNKTKINSILDGGN